MLLREAARESERNAGAGSGNIGGDDRLATLAGVASQLVANKSSVPGAETSAPEILVVPTSGGGNNDRGGGGGNVDVSANVTVETSRPRSLPTGIGLGVRSVLFYFSSFQLSFKKKLFYLVPRSRIFAELKKMLLERLKKIAQKVA
jgi:hypothetical protein